MTAIVLSFVLYSPKVEEARIVTINNPLVITQERKTPAYALFQQAKRMQEQTNQERKPDVVTVRAIKSEVFLTTQSFQKDNPTREISTMQLAKQEIASPQDAGFTFESKIAKRNVEQESKLGGIDSMRYGGVSAPTQFVQSPGKSWGTLRGKFEVRDGVGIIDHIVEIKRVEEGQIREQGTIDLKAGSYSINIESPQGILIAQVRDRNGLIIGEDQQRFINLKSKSGYYEGPDIRVGPRSGLAANAAPIGNAKSRIMTSLFSDQHFLDKPSDKFNNVSAWSSTISRSVDAAAKFRKVTSIRQTSDQSEIPLFTEKWVSGVISYVSDQTKIQYKSNNLPVVVGRVFQDGKPLVGATVEIENNEGLVPIYLDAFMIPNIKQGSTSENGYFMFIGIEPGEYNISALMNNKRLSHQIFLAEDSAVAYQNLHSESNPRLVLVRTFDAFTGAPADADILTNDINEIFESQVGIASYRTTNSAGISTSLVRPKTDHMPIRYVQDARKEYIHIPLIREQWLLEIQKLKKINDQPSTGTIVGFVPEGDYSVYLVNADYQPENIIYFDHVGNPSEKATPGGGFIIYNAPTGSQEVIVQSEKTEKIYSQVFVVGLNQTQISHFTD